MKAKLVSLLVILLFPLCIYAQQFQAKDILGGIWRTKAAKGIELQFFEKEGKYYAKMYLPNHKEALDNNNENKSLRKRKLHGLTIITGLSFSKNKYSGGKAYAPQNGMIVNCSIEWIDKNKIVITGSKYFITKKQTWYRE